MPFYPCIIYRFAAGDPTLFDTYAAELVGLSPNVLLAGNTPTLCSSWIASTKHFCALTALRV
jgi:hypothetical protein